MSFIVEIPNVTALGAVQGAEHRCIKCGAIWRRWDPVPELGFKEVTWSVQSPTHGDCCEKGYMDLIMIPLDAEPL